eukprot:TRINITY_DN18397_c1_g1_i1.p1 TRINITY_DN18397_c1_g1~~TRINITY_DN18397_c1_g1_i1.p1  ORF type:complete len:421 (+),score=47.94 TRINITY_DN18397_c1_g1_i1:175-1437(+)
MEEKVRQLSEENIALKKEIQDMKQWCQMVMTNAHRMMTASMMGGMPVPQGLGIELPGGGGGGGATGGMAGDPIGSFMSQTPQMLSTQQLTTSSNTPPPPPPRTSQTPLKTNSRSPSRSKRNSRKPVGQAIKRLRSGTPSRAPDDRDPANFQPPPHETSKPPLTYPLERRRHPYTARDVEALSNLFSQRNANKPDSESLIKKKWSLPEHMSERLLRSYGIGNADLVHDGSEKNVQRTIGSMDSSSIVDRLHVYVIFQIMVYTPDLGAVPPAVLQRIVKRLTKLSDYELNHLHTSITKRLAESSRQSPQHTGTGESTAEPAHYSTITFLVSIISVLVWHSADALGDALDVSYRILKRTGSYNIGQAEMVEVTSRLCELSVPSDTVFLSGDGSYVNQAAAQRVQDLAKRIHSLLRKRIEYTKS